MKRSFLRQLAIALALVLLLVSTTAAAIGDLNPSDLDPSFAAGAGRVITSPTGADYTFAIALTPDGKFVTAGQTSVTFPYTFEVSRFLPDGSPDTTFNGTGIATADFSEPKHSRYGVVHAMLVQPDGKIILGGHVFDPSEHDFGLARFTATGDLDSTFGSEQTGLVRTHFGADPNPNDIHDNIIFSLGFQPDGKFIAAGRVFDGENYVTGFARYCPDGLLDDGINCGTPSFGVDGKITFPNNGFAASPNLIAMFPDGRFVVGGNTGPDAPDSDFALYGLCANGELADGAHCDWSFGENGRVTTDISASFDEITALTIQRDGKILALGWTNLHLGITDYDYALVRYNPDGSLDTTFNGSGKVYLNVAGNQDSPVALAVAPDNKIVVVGNNWDASTTYAIIRFCSNGTLDNGSNCGSASFGNLGISIENGFASGSGNQASAVALQKDGRIIVAGRYYSPAGIISIGLARYMAGSHLSFSGVSVGDPFALGNTNAIIQLAQGGPCDFTIDKYLPQERGRSRCFAYSLAFDQ